MDALCAHLTDRLENLPLERRHDIDGCETILRPPEKPKHLSRILVDLEDYFKTLTAFSSIGRGMVKDRNDGVFPSVESLRDGGAWRPSNRFLDMAMIVMQKDYSFKDVCDAFSHPSKVDYDVEELISDYAAGLDEDDDKDAERTVEQICAFAGVVRGLEDHKRYHLENGIEKCVGKSCAGHTEYEEEEPETIHGWSGSWTEESNKPKKNSFCFGIKMGAIIDFANEHAKTIAVESPQGTAMSSPRARFHQDMSEVIVSPKGVATVATGEDIAICRARHDHLHDYVYGDDVFYGDDGAYSTKQWNHDGLIGFSHVGGGWKNREFKGYLYSFDVGNIEGQRGFVSHEFNYEFWSTPNSILADSVNDTAWVKADERIKGFSIRRGDPTSFYTQYVFNVLSDKAALASVSTSGAEAKRKKLGKEENQLNQNLIVFGSSRFGYLNNGILQEWKLNDANRHDGIRRMVRMEYLDEDIAALDEEEILQCGTWMDESGSAEVTRGKKPDSIRITDIVTPYSIGYIPGERFAFVHNDRSEIVMYDSDLRELSRLVGFGTDKVDVVQPKFVCNKLSEGQGAMMWDLRSQRPMYSLPISGNTDIAWVASSPPNDESNQPPLLLTDRGDFYMFGKDPGEDQWGAEEAWSELESKRSSDRGVSDCCIS